MLLKIKTKEGSKELDLPDVPEKVKLSQSLRFGYAYEQMLEWRRKELPDDELTYGAITELYHRREYLDHVINCASEFFDLDPEDFMGFKKGSVKDHLTKLSEGNLDILADSVLAIFTNIYLVISKYTPRLRGKEDFIFIHNMKRWHIPKFLVDSIYGEDDGDLMVAEAIEALEVKRIVRDMKAKKQVNPVSATYTDIVGITSILARLEDEVFPDDPYLANALVEQRKVEFQNIDMVNGNDLNFFLLNIGEN